MGLTAHEFVTAGLVPDYRDIIDNLVYEPSKDAITLAMRCVK
jgi:hypothetical protein